MFNFFLPTGTSPDVLRVEFSNPNVVPAFVSTGGSQDLSTFVTTTLFPLNTNGTFSTTPAVSGGTSGATGAGGF
jgi:hypothetical protein